jgi:membrane-bound lytic murein transglycosylase A
LSRGGFFGQVHQTINTASKSATPISTYTINMRALSPAFRLLLLAALVGCTPALQREDLTCPMEPGCPTCPQCPGVKPPETARYQESTFAALPGWQTATLAASLRTFIAGCVRPVVHARVCELARAVPPNDEAAARSFFESAFAPYALISSDNGDTGLITGYYEPVIEGARSRSERNRIPIFGVPEDLMIVDLSSVNPDVRNMRLRGRIDGRRVVPYYSRAEIDSKGEAFPAPVLGWTADPVALFFMQIQGSGQLRLDSGERVRLGYADQNGHPFRSLGRYLVERGELKLEDASMQGIKAWAAANPARLKDALNQNPSYVFFRELPAAAGALEGPIGALGVPLSAEYSVAVDRRFIPLGSPVYLATTYPLSEEKLERLMAAQDTGGAIRGVVRADFYWGGGPEAGNRAGRMRQQGKIWLLWPRGEPLPRGGEASAPRSD